MPDFNLGRIRFVWQGLWEPSRDYVRDDVVQETDSSFVCIEAHTSGSTFAENSDKFEIMARGASATPTTNVGDIVYRGNVEDERLPIGSTGESLLVDSSGVPEWGIPEADLSVKSTDDLSEGSNLYYTDTRARDAVSASGDLSYNSSTGEFSVTTYKSADFDTDFSGKDTDDLSEGTTNLYYTDTRARNAVSAAGDLSYNSTTGAFSFTERTDAEVRGLLSAAGDLSYNSTTGEFSVTTFKSSDFDSNFAGKSTTDLSEGTNLYYTDARVRNAVSSSGDLAYDSATGEFSVTTYKSTDFDTDFSGKSTDDLSEGTTNLYYLDSRVDSHLSGGTGVSYSSGTISIGQSVGTSDNVEFNDVVVAGDLTVSGTTTTVNTETLDVADNNVTLNSNYSGSSPTENGGITVNRGTESDVVLQWNETNDHWEIESGGTIGRILTTGDEGSGNGLDADLLDGEQGSYYLNYNNLTNTPSNLSDFSNDENYIKLTDLSASGDLSYDSATGEFSIAQSVGYESTDFDDDFSAKTTDNLSEGISNLYYTDSRVRGAVSASGDLSYDSATGIFSFTARTDSEVRNLFSAAGDLSYNSPTGEFSVTTYKSSDFDSDFSGKSTDDLSEGSNLYYTDARVDSHLSGGTGVSYSSGSISIGQAVGTNDNVSFNDINISGDLTVSGTTTTLNTTTLDVEDINITVANGATDAAAADGAGITADLGSDGDATFTYVSADDRWAMNKSLATDLIGDVTGTVSDISNHDTDDLSEGTGNFYYTDTRTRNAVSASGDLSYDSVTGTFSFTERTDSQVRGLFSSSGDLSYNVSTGEFSVTTYKSSDFDTDFGSKSTGDLSEGTNLYYTDTRVRNALSASGDLSYDSATGTFSFTERTDSEVRNLFSASGDLSYDSATGEFSVTTYKSTDFDTDFSSKSTDDLSEGTGNFYYTDARVDSHLSGGTGVSYSSGSISIGQAVGTNDNVEFNDVAVNGSLTVNGGIDADTLDSQSPSFYLDYDNFTNTPPDPAALSFVTTLIFS